MKQTANEAIQGWFAGEAVGSLAPQITPSGPLDGSYKRILYPWEIQFVQEGGDTRTEAYRYIVPAASQEVYTHPIKVVDLAEFCVHCIFGGASATGTANMRVFGTFATGDPGTAYAHRIQLNAAGTDFDTAALATDATGAQLVFSSANTRPDSNAHRRMWVPQAIVIGITTSVALVPVTLFVYGR